MKTSLLRIAFVMLTVAVVLSPLMAVGDEIDGLRSLRIGQSTPSTSFNSGTSFNRVRSFQPLTRLRSLDSTPSYRSRGVQDSSDTGRRSSFRSTFRAQPVSDKVEPSRRNYLGNYSANKFNANSTSNKFGAGSRYSPKSINNPYGQYGSKYSPNSATNPYATDTPKLYNSRGEYRGKLSTNRFDADSISNPYGRYGSKYSPDSVNNRFGAGSRFLKDSPTNKFGTGLKIYGKD